MKAKIDIAALKKLVPELPLSDIQFEEEIRKTTKNVSIRPTDEQAVRLIYLDSVCHIPKAAVIKDCLDKHLNAFYQETLAGLNRLDAHIRGIY